ncbi:MAG: HIT domain-containing protein [Acidobacteriota bacterium]|jgi:ATP adenylyltransferase
MDRLWSPWRFDYVSNVDKVDSCVFCWMLKESRDVENHILWRGKKTFLILNLYPYTTGHLLIVSNRHISTLNEASDDELFEFITLSRHCENALRREYQSNGFNMGFNIGRAAGAGIEQHLHMHVLPRWFGDSNFVSSIGETRILPEELDTTYKRLIPYFENY